MRKYWHLTLLMVSFLLLLNSCQEDNSPLPILGHTYEEAGKTIHHTIRDFAFTNQDSMTVSNKDFEGKVYVADHFFISCPTICPKLTKSMLRIHDQFKAEDRLLLLSHSIDTKYDTVPRLKKYADNLGVTSKKWHFVTGEKDEILDIAEDYFNVALEDADAPGGYNHSGRLVLVDKNKNLRAFCDGTDEESVTGFLKDIKKLLKEMADERS